MGTRCSGSFAHARRPAIWRAGLAAGLWMSFCACGCLPPPDMRLSTGSLRGTQRGVWWSVSPGAGLHGPIVGVEQRLSNDRVRQWLAEL